VFPDSLRPGNKVIGSLYVRGYGPRQSPPPLVWGAFGVDCGEIQWLCYINICTLDHCVSQPGVRELNGFCRPRLKCDGTRAETRFRLSSKRASPFKSAGASFQSTTGSRGVPISGSNAGYTIFRGSVKSTGYSLHSPLFPSLPLPCVTACHHVSTGLYQADHKVLLHLG
jgi:hypothetical protein